MEEILEMKRHSMSHVLAKALCKHYDNVALAIGPAIDNGFYYDIDADSVVREEDFDAIEKLMRQIIANDEPFRKEVISKKEALSLFAKNKYKVEIINELPEDEQISVYYLGDDFVDLCRGPHVENTKMLRSFAFKINKISGAYWRGNEKNKMLQRVYVFGFEKNDELKAHLKMLEEAAKRDHRKLGTELDLFFLSEFSPGCPFYMPKGVELKNELIKFWREVHKTAGYVEIETPIILNRSLWEVSGHWNHYKENMYHFATDDEEFAIKPMNCPGGIILYKQHLHSYKEFPLRVGELGKVHRREASGTLHGLFRVRSFTQDDAHIFMLPTQIENEVMEVLKLVDEVYSKFGLSYHLELSTMPDDHLGDEKDWQFAEESLKNALINNDKGYVINEGDGAFYGPKIDIHIKDAIGRTWQCGTIQLDMQMPKKFNIEYVDHEGNRREPVMIHRVIYGSIDRFLGIITENFAGAFPLWLSPEQVRVLNVSENSLNYAQKINEQLQDVKIKSNIDDRNEKIGKKVRDAQVKKVNYMVVVGDNEMRDGTISVRHRKNGDLGSMTFQDFVELLQNEIDTKSIV